MSIDLQNTKCIFWHQGDEIKHFTYVLKQNRLAEKRVELLGLLSQLMSEQESRREELRKRLVIVLT